MRAGLIAIAVLVSVVLAAAWVGVGASPLDLARALVFAAVSRPRRSLVERARDGARAVKAAAVMHINLEDGASCPTLEDLVRSNHLAPASTLDPWGTPYVLRCEGDDIRVSSAGRDRIAGTGDDVPHDIVLR